MRALVKHELRNIWMMIVYFVGCFGAGIWTLQSYLQNRYEEYLWNGYNYDMSYNLLGIIRDMYPVYLVAMGLGLLVLLYIQFRDNKSVGVSSFIKSLPYTNKQIYSVKLGCGVLSFSVPFLLGGIGVVAVGNGAKDWLSVIERVSPIGAEIATQNEVGQIMLCGLLIYSITLMCYVLGFWMQYVINLNVPSLIVSACSVMAPYFVMLTGIEYFKVLRGDVITGGSLAYVNTFRDLLCIPTYLSSYKSGYEIIVGEHYRSGYIRDLGNIEWMGIKTIMFLLLVVILILAISVCNKNYHAEHQEVFVSKKWAERVLKVGVTMCSMSVGIFLTLGFFNGYGMQQVIVMHIAMLICGVIGYLLIRKICTIGQR